MRTKRCKNCGQNTYEKRGELYICKYCKTEYPEEPKNALQTILGFTERQMDKNREDKKEHQLFIRKHLWVFILIIAGCIALSIAMAILEKQGMI